MYLMYNLVNIKLLLFITAQKLALVDHLAATSISSG